MPSKQEEAVHDAQMRYVFGKTFVEPVSALASNDSSAQGFLPNHEHQLLNTNPADLVVKSRKIAHSWGFANRALAVAATKTFSTQTVISFDEAEAKEKLRFLDMIYKAACDRTPALLKELRMSDGSESRTFKGTGAQISFSSRRPPTGRSGDTIIDEFSIEPPGRVSASDLLIGAIGATTHKGQVLLAGTQRGTDTMFYKISQGLEDAFAGNPLFENAVMPQFTVMEYPWWSSPALSTNPIEAVVLAPGMTTEQRVSKYGNERLLSQYAIYMTTPEQGLEVFQREFELMVLDDKESYYSLGLIESCYTKSHDHWFEFTEIDGTRWPNEDCLAEAKLIIDKMAVEIKRGNFRGEWGWAMDIARHKDYEEIWIGHSDEFQRDMVHPRASISALKLPFPGKEALVEYLMARLPITRGCVDATKGSVGVQFGEWTEGKWGQRAAGFQFTQSSKQILASSLKVRFESRKIELPRFSQDFSKLRNQLLQMKKIQKPSGLVLFDIARSGKEHGDIAWALCMFSDLFDKPIVWTPRQSVVIRPQEPRTFTQQYQQSRRR